jgi:hypothetical protein
VFSQNRNAIWKFGRLNVVYHLMEPNNERKTDLEAKGDLNPSTAQKSRQRD